MRIALLALCSFPLFSQTVINDKPASERLLGRHPLTLQWLAFDKTVGSVTVTDTNGTYRVKGEQRGKGTDFLSIDGEVTQISALNFSFRVKIAMQVSLIANGKECVREGTFLFRISGARQYWRMRENKNPCDEVTDYIDIFFTNSN